MRPRRDKDVGAKEGDRRMVKLSIIIITKNEANDIRACLESVSWADEIIVVDSGSDDGTPEICREFGANVYKHNWPGFGPQKNRALSYACGEWVFSIDADERITPELRSAIQTVLQHPNSEFDAYYVSRFSNYCGRFMRYSGWQPDYVLRLFRRGKAKFSDDLVHERLLTDNETGRLAGKLLHFSYANLEEVLHKVNQYSSVSAEMLYQRGQRASLRRALLHGIWAFIRTYFLRAGFLDGAHGFMLAVSNAEGSYYRYVKLMLRQQNP